MIKVTNVTKKFNDFTAVKDLTCTIKSGCIYGIIGTNGAGKSTLLRLITGVYKSDTGSITIDDLDVYDNVLAKEKFVYISDELFFIPQATMEKMAKYYGKIYKNFSMERFYKLAMQFKLDTKAYISTFSKGMKRQVCTILSLAARTQYIFLDESFDGLDPSIRKMVKDILYEDVCERNATAIITSHALRELEDTCDELALLNKGSLLLQSEVENIKTSLSKVQVAFKEDFDEDMFSDIDLVNYSQKGRIATFIIHKSKEEQLKKIRDKNPVLVDVLPLSLEEYFIYKVSENTKLEGENNEAI